MELYCGIDLHSNNSYLVVLEAGGRRQPGVFRTTWR